MLNIHTPNSQQYGQIVLGVLGMGGILSTANPAYTVHELNYQMKLTGAKALFTEYLPVPSTEIPPRTNLTVRGSFLFYYHNPVTAADKLRDATNTTIYTVGVTSGVDKSALIEISIVQSLTTCRKRPASRVIIHQCGYVSLT